MSSRIIDDLILELMRKYKLWREIKRIRKRGFDPEFRPELRMCRVYL